jgi:hypothetical protein
MDLVGESKINEFLGKFVKNYQFKERPYPSTHDFYSTMIPFLAPGQQTLVDDQWKRITLYKNKIVQAKGKKLANGQFEIRFKVELDKYYVDSLGGNEKKAPITEQFFLALLNEETPKVKADVLRMEKLKLINNQEIVWTSAIKPKYVCIDPLHTLTDIFMDDNAKLIDWD